MTATQLATLVAMAEIEQARGFPAMLKEIAARFGGLAKATISERLDRLETSGHVERTATHTTGCRRLTLKGRRAAKHFLTPLVRLRSAWEAASPEERNAFRKNKRGPS